MDQPVTPGRAPQVEAVLTGVLVVIGLVVASGFLFEIPFGFGGWELMIAMAPVAVAAVVLARVLRVARRRASAPDHRS